MTPVHDRNAGLLGWFDGNHLFDLNLDWVAFHRAGHLFSCANAEWLGPLNGGSFLDRSGRVVAWLAGTVPAGALAPSQPMRPMRPLPPRRPLFPQTPPRPSAPFNPVGGWSGLGWLEWLRKALPAAPVEQDVAPDAQETAPVGQAANPDTGDAGR